MEQGAAHALARATSALPGGGEDRPGQVEMAEAVARAIASGRHLLVQAGTGTGKSLAYLVPAALSGRPVVVATATKALQDQLAGKDLPFLVEHLDVPLTYAVLKGRSNYVCRQRLGEIDAVASQLSLDGLAERAPEDELRAVREWAMTTTTGDRAELPVEPSPATWAAVSVGARECPGATRCPKGDSCFAEAARREAAEADVLVVNLHLYGLHLESGGMVLPEHDLVVIDEAHQLEDVISSTFGVDLTAGRFVALARSGRAVLDDPQSIDALEAAGVALAGALSEHVGRRLRGQLEPEIADAVADARIAVDGFLGALKGVPTDRGDETSAQAVRAAKTAGTLADELDAVRRVPDGHVMWVEGPDASPALRLAPVDVGPTLAERLWSQTTAVLTSATVPPAAVTRLGLPEDRVDQIDVGSPFDHGAHALLYCAAHLPDPREASYEGALHAELLALIEAAGGRTLALFTSYRAMDAAVEVLEPRLEVPVLTQRDLPKPALVEAFAAERRPACSPPWASGRASTCPGAPSRSSPSTGSPSPAPTSHWCRPAGRRPGPTPSASWTSTAPPRSSPRARAASSAGPPTAASWPSSTPAWPGPGTAGTWSTPCPPCAAPRTAPRPSPSSARSPPERPSARAARPVRAYSRESR